MNSQQAIRSIVAVIIALTACTGTSSVAAQDVPVKNAGFEAWGKRGPSDWFIADAGRKRGAISSSPSRTQNGAKQLKLSPNKKNAKPGDPLGVGQIMPIGSYAGKTLRVSAFLGSSGGATAIVGTGIVGRNGQSVGGGQLRQVDSDGKMNRHELELAVPEDATDSQLILFCVVEGGAGSGFFDGLSVQVAGGGSAPTLGNDDGAPTETAQFEGKALPIKNASFEAWGRRGPDNWFVAEAASKRGTIDAGASGARDGSKLLKLSPSNQNAGPGDPLGVGQIVPVGDYAGQTLGVTVFLGSTGDAFAILGAHVIDSSNKIVAGRQLRQQDSDGELKLHEAELTIPDDVAGSQMIIFCAVEGGSGTALIDGLSIRPIATSNVPQPIDDGGVLTASVHIDARREIRRIPRSLFGTNVEWIQNGNDILDLTQKTYRPDVVAEVRKLGVSLIRFPGGVFSDHYDWRDGIGNPNRRPTTLHYADGPKSTHHFGTDEALGFARRVNAALLVTVNAGTGSAQDAAEWVAYINGEGGKSPKMDRVKFWEIGNELYIRTGATMQPAAYAKKVKQFARAMKAVDPSIKVGAIGGINQGSYVVVQYPKWTETVLDEAGSEIDFLAVHNAYAPSLINTGKLDGEEVYMALLAAPLHVERNLATLSQEIRKRVPNKAKRPSIAITEWGPFFHIFPSNEWVDHVKTLGSAVYVADMLRVFAQSPDVEIANFFKLSEPTFMGWIGPDRSGTYIPKPSALAFQLYSQHFGEIVVDTTVSAPTYKGPQIGLVDPLKVVPLLTAIASLSADKKTLYINVINKYLRNSITADVDVSGVKLGARATVRTLTGSSVDAHTGTRLTEIPGFEWATQETVTSGVGFNDASMVNVRIDTSRKPVSSSTLTHTFPPHSVTNFEIRLP